MTPDRTKNVNDMFSFVHEHEKCINVRDTGFVQTAIIFLPITDTGIVWKVLKEITENQYLNIIYAIMPISHFVHKMY